MYEPKRFGTISSSPLQAVFKLPGDPFFFRNDGIPSAS